MKNISILFTILMLVSCLPKSSKEQAMAYWKNKQFKSALNEISKAIEENPDSSNFYLFRASIYDVMSDYEAEIQDLNKIIELNKNEKEVLNAYHQRGIVKSNLGLHQEGLNDIDYFISNKYKTALSTDEIAEAYINKASILYLLNDNIKAKEFYQLALSTTNSDIKASAYMGLANLSETPQEALKLLNKALNIAPDNAKIYANMATSYIEQEDIEKAYSCAKKSLSLDPYNAENNFNLGQIYYLYLSQPDSAKKYYERTIKIEPNSIKSAPAYINLAIMENYCGNFTNAYEYAMKATKLMPDNGDIQYNVAHILSNMQKTEEALHAISKAIEINPTEVEYYNLKGAILIGMQKYEEAISVFHKCKNIKPDFGGAYYNLGYIYGELHIHEQSIYYYNKAVQLNFDLKNTLVNLALQEIEANEISNACIHLKKAYQLGRTDIKPLLDRYCR